MQIESLKLRDFRNYNLQEITFDSGINLILGENGQGKTNLLEAIYLLAIGRSFRTTKDKDMLSFEKDSLLIDAHILSSQRNYRIEIKIGKEIKKAIKINSLPIERLSDLLGIFNVVIFAPEDLKLVKEGPRERRIFLDREISQIRPLYYRYLSDYKRALNQRNNLLKTRRADVNLLAVYEEQLGESALHIMKYRKDFVESMKPIATATHRRISSGKENLEIHYSPHLKKYKDYTKAQILEEYDQSRQEDIHRGTTTKGPHKDDLELYINGIDIRAFGSQGQKRSAAISLKLSEITLIHQEKGEYPVVLLDDIFSELDDSRQRMLMDHLNNIQTFVTTTHDLDHKENMCRYQVEQGTIKRI